MVSVLNLWTTAFKSCSWSCGKRFPFGHLNFSAGFKKRIDILMTERENYEVNRILI
jgi:hypothetical protein